MATNILQELAQAARIRVADQKAACPAEEMHERALKAPRHGVATLGVAATAGEQAQGSPADARPFETNLKAPGMSFICECKKASPSKGLIAPDFPYVQIAREYEETGAAAISVLTEPTRFLGSDDYLQQISAAVSTPTLRKDFVVDAYMIDQARVLGASAVLLICSILDAETLEAYIQYADEVGLSALVEAHSADEVRMAVSAGAKIIGVNNRNLADFTIDFQNSIRLRELVPPEIAFVTESGIKTADDIALLSAHGVDAVLIGETLMRAPNKRAMLDELRGGLK